MGFQKMVGIAAAGLLISHVAFAEESTVSGDPTKGVKSDSILRGRAQTLELHALGVKVDAQNKVRVLVVEDKPALSMYGLSATGRTLSLTDCVQWGTHGNIRSCAVAPNTKRLVLRAWADTKYHLIFLAP